MHHSGTHAWGARIAALTLLVFAPLAAAAQTVTGQAAAVQATVLGAVTTLAGTGSLASAADMLGASSLSGSVPLVGGLESLWAATGSSPSGVNSQSSAANLLFSVANQTISAGFLMAEVTAPASGAPSAGSIITGLAFNGIPVAASGAPNQVVSVPGLSVVLNEIQSTTSGTTVNALHITSLDGLVNIVVATATAGISGTSGGGGILPPLGL